MLWPWSRAHPAVGQPHRESPGGQRLDRGHLRAEPHLGAELAQQPRGGLAVQVAERDGRRADVRGVPGAEQRRADHGGGQGQVRVVPRDVQRGDREQVPEHPPGALALAVGGQPVTQPLGVEARPVRVEEAHGQRGPGDPEPLGGRQQRVGDQGLAHVQRAGEPRPAQPGLAVRTEHGDVEAVLQPHRAGHPEPGDQLPVGRAAAQEHVLAVVDDQPARVNEQVAPPSRGLDSSRVTRAPVSRSAIAAVIPASPPPITTTWRPVSGCPVLICPVLI